MRRLSGEIFGQLRPYIPTWNKKKQKYVDAVCIIVYICVCGGNIPAQKKGRSKMEKEFKIMLTEKAARLICTFIRRSIFEQYERNMSEAGFTPEQNKQITYDTIEAFEDLRSAIGE